MGRQCVVLVAICFAACTLARAQPAAQLGSRNVLTHLTSVDGLPDDTVYDLHFDADGWMWLATASGVYRYDGVDFVAFRSSLARHAETHDIQTDAAGNLYVANFRQQIFRVSGDSLSVALDLGTHWNDYAAYHVSGWGISALVDRTLVQRQWAAGAGAHQRTIGYDNPVRLPRLIHSGHANLSLIGSRDGQPLATLRDSTLQPLPADRGGRLHTVIERHGDVVAVRNARVDDIAELQWQVVTPGELRTFRKTPNPIPGQRIRAFATLPDGTEVLAGDRGVFAYVPAGNTWRSISPRSDVSALALDASGILWAATLDQGLFAITATPTHEVTYGGLSGAITSLAYTSGGTLLAGTHTSELYVLHAATSELVPTEQASLVWWGGEDTYFGTRYQIRQRNGAVSVRDIGPTRLVALNQLKAGAALGDGLFAFATIAGLHLVGHGHHRYQEVSESGRATYTTLRIARAYDLAFDPVTRRLWTAYSDSLFVHSPVGTRSTYFPALGTSPGHVERVELHDSSADTLTPVLLFGAEGTGVFRLEDFDRAEHPTRLTAVGDIRGKEVRNIYGGAGYAWVTTEAGIDRCGYDATTGALMCIPFGTTVGLPAAPPTALAARGDTVAVAYGKRVLRVPVHVAGELGVGLTASRPQPVARFVAAEVAGRDDRLTPGGEIALLAGSEPLALQPRVPAYTLGSRQRFRYRIPSLDTAWRVVAGARPEVYLASVPEGRHRVDVALDEPGAVVTAVSLIARLPWWQRTWVLALAACCSVALAGAYLLVRANRRSRLLRLQAELRRSRLTAIAAQMNPHFIFNALNSIQEFILDQDPRSANAYLGRFARLMRLTLDHSSAEHVPLSAEVEAMRIYVELEQLRTDQAVEVDFTVDPHLPTRACLPPLLIQPFIENAFKHGLARATSPHRRLRVRYGLMAPGRLSVTVQDNGIGRAAAETHARTRHDGKTGFALSAIDERIRLLNAARPGYIRYRITDLHDDSGRACGTRVDVLVDLGAIGASASDQAVPSPAVASLTRPSISRS